MIKIIIADDHALVREGLKSLLREEGDFAVIAEANNGHELLASVREHQCDVVVLDISMPGKSGLEVLSELRSQYPKLPILLLTMHAEDRFAMRAIRLGASGYVTKDAAPRELVTAIRKVVKGGKYVSAQLAEQLASTFGTTRKTHESLSDREFQVFSLIATGKKVNQIAKELHISAGTVYTHRARVYQKMSMHNDSELTRYAVENKLID